MIATRSASQHHSPFTARKLPLAANGVFTGFSPHVTSLTDYYPFGSGMAGRTVTEGYRYGFQGQETDAEYFNGAVSFKYRVHDARLGRFLSIDPLAPDYPWNSTYAFSENRVVDSRELEGLEKASIHGENCDVETGPRDGANSMMIIDEELGGAPYVATLGDGSLAAGLPEAVIEGTSVGSFGPKVHSDQNECNQSISFGGDIQTILGQASFAASSAGELLVSVRNSQVKGFMDNFSETSYRGAPAHIDQHGKVYRNLGSYALNEVPSAATRYSGALGKAGGAFTAADQLFDVSIAMKSNDPSEQLYHINSAIIKIPSYVPGPFGVVYGAVIMPVYNQGIVGVRQIQASGGSATPFLIPAGGGFPLNYDK
jgi:RHS repeat-associated protein